MTADQLVKKLGLKNKTWTSKGFHGVLHTMYPVMDSSFWMHSYFKDSPTIEVVISENDFLEWHWNNEDLDRIRNLFFARLKKKPGYLKQLNSLWNNRLKKFDGILKKVHKTDLRKLTDKQLVKLYDEFYGAYGDEYTVFMALGDAVSMRADFYLAPIFQKALGKDYGEVFPVLVKTDHHSFIDQEEIDRKKLVSRYRKGRLSDKALSAHADKYFYIKNNYATGDYLTPKYFLWLIKKEAKSAVRKTKNAQTPRQSELIKKYRLNSWHRTLLNVASQFFEFQDTRKKYVLKANYYEFLFLKELSRRTKIPVELLKYSVYPEFGKVLEGSISTKELKDRKSLCVTLYTRDGYQILTGQAARELKKMFAQNQEGVKELSGMVASPGKAKGKVTIVLKADDVKKMKQGNILVSSMTRPEMVPAMKKAAAIITDEGGITSHAAIVSREMGIPCILGTKTATKILKDGDVVEVDTATAKVKILK